MMRDASAVFQSKSDIKLWRELSSFESKTRDERRTASFQTAAEKIIGGIDPVHPAVLAGYIKALAYSWSDRAESLVIGLAGRSADPFPILTAAEVLLDKGSADKAASLIDKAGERSYLAMKETLRGRLAIIRDSLPEAEEHLNKANRYDSTFLPAYDYLHAVEKYRGWPYLKNIELMRSGRDDEPYGGTADAAAEQLHAIYFEMYAGSVEEAYRILRTSDYLRKGDERFSLAEARVLSMKKDSEGAADIFDKMLEKDRSDSLIAEAAKAFLAVRDYDRVLEICSWCSEPDDPRFVEPIITSLCQIGNINEMRRRIDSYLDNNADFDGYVLCAEQLTHASLYQESKAVIGYLESGGSDLPSKVYLIESMNELGLGRITSALRPVIKAIKVSPDCAECRCQRARVYIASGNAQKAMADINAVIEKDPGNMTALRLMRDALRSEKKFEESLDICYMMLEAEPENGDVMKDIAVLLDRLGREDESFEAYRKAIRIRKDSQLFDEVVALLFSSGRYEKLIDICREFKDTYGRSAEMWVLRGNAEYALGRFRDASSSYSEALGLSPRNSTILHSLGMAQEASGDLDDAETSYDKAIIEDFDNIDYWLSKAVVQEGVGNYSGAISSYNRAILLSSDCDYALIRKGVVLSNLGMYTEALHFMRLAMRINPSNVRLLGMIRDISKHIGDDKGVIAACMGIARQSRNDESAYVDMCHAFINLKDYVNAKKTLDTGLSLNPGSLVCQYARLDLCSSTGDLSGTIEACRAVLQRAPDDLNVKITLGESLASTGDLEAARAVYDDVLASDPKNLAALTRKAKLSSTDGRGVASIYQDILADDPENIDALCGLADVLSGDGDIAGALNLMDRAMNVDGCPAGVFVKMSELFISDGRTDRAVRTIKDALERFPKDAAVWGAAAKLQASAGEYDEALLSVESSIRLGDDSAVIYGLRGRIQEAIGADEAAINSYHLAALREPEDTSYPLAIADIYVRRGSRAPASKEFESVLDIDSACIPAIVGLARIQSASSDRSGVKDSFKRYLKADRRTDELDAEFKILLESVGLDPDGNKMESVPVMANDVIARAAAALVRADDRDMLEPIPESKRGEVIQFIKDVGDFGAVGHDIPGFDKYESMSSSIMSRCDSDDVLALMPVAYAETNDMKAAKKHVSFILKVLSAQVPGEEFSDVVAEAAKGLAQSPSTDVRAVMKDYRLGVYSAKAAMSSVHDHV